MSEEHTPCREGIELRCANCGEVVSCHGEGFSSIVTELLADDGLGFGTLLSALLLSGWEFEVSQLVVDGNPRVTLRGTPVNTYGRPRLDKRDVTAMWERRPTGWVADSAMTGYQAIGGGLFRPASATELATLVLASPASWIRVPH
ncbi:hypothetical protein AB0M45_09355 [Nocardia sp. NPDC051787]|uniref:hypothetical protein n=1 Tax=Nocardia sp. NPDC051787 TaxID=3155415 RepID=UPI0034344CFF